MVRTNYFLSPRSSSCALAPPSSRRLTPPELFSLGRDPASSPSATLSFLLGLVSPLTARSLSRSPFSFFFPPSSPPASAACCKNGVGIPAASANVMSSPSSPPIVIPSTWSTRDTIPGPSKSCVVFSGMSISSDAMLSYLVQRKTWQKGGLVPSSLRPSLTGHQCSTNVPPTFSAHLYRGLVSNCFRCRAYSLSGRRSLALDVGR